MTRLTTLADPEAVAETAAVELAGLLAGALRARGVANIALSGGTTPGRAYELLGAKIKPWNRPARNQIGMWFADERCVGPDDPDSNFRMVSQTLLAAAEIAPDTAHRMKGELGPSEGARQYAQSLTGTVATYDDMPLFDVIVLGIGPEGHIASLFPSSDALEETGPDGICLGIYDSPKPPPERITLGLDVMRAARRCVLLATGVTKADALETALGEPSKKAPASLLVRDRLMVIADDRACPGASER